MADVAADILVLSAWGEKSDIREHQGSLTMAKSPRMVPGAEAKGLVAPRRTRPVLTASLPSQTIAQMGPLSMSRAVLMYCDLRNDSGEATNRRRDP